MTSRRILLIEDDDDIREAMAFLLQGEGYAVVQAKDGEQALRLLRSSGDFCLILLDLFMPVKNGWEFRAEQRADPRIADVPVIIVSADRNASETAIALGALDFLVKPVDLDRLLGTIAAFC